MFMTSLKSTASWVIVDNETNKPLFETFSKKIASSINKNRYKAIPILEYLQNFNKGLA
jgi:hypothetical protein